MEAEGMVSKKEKDREKQRYIKALYSKISYENIPWFSHMKVI